MQQNFFSWLVLRNDFNGVCFLGYTVTETGTCQARQEEKTEVVKRESVF